MSKAVIDVGDRLTTVTMYDTGGRIAGKVVIDMANPVEDTYTLRNTDVFKA